MKMKLQMPKFKIRLSILLWSVLVLVILAEIWILYQYVFLGIVRQSETGALAPARRINIDRDAYDSSVEWLRERESFVLPEYTLRKEGFGRDNPFAQY